MANQFGSNVNLLQCDHYHENKYRIAREAPKELGVFKSDVLAVGYDGVIDEPCKIGTEGQDQRTRD